MVKNSRTPPRPDALRSLNQPRAIEVESRPTRRGVPRPLVIIEDDRRETVERVEDFWSIDDEWWLMRPIRRNYYRVRLAAGHIRTIYHDLVRNSWFSQRT